MALPLATEESESNPAARLARDLGDGVSLGQVRAPSRRRLASGIAEVDRALGGGIPCGEVSEIVGRRSSGCTALSYAVLAASTRRGETVAVVDSADVLHPLSLEVYRADLGRVLWVRPPTLKAALKSTELILDAGGFSAVLFDLGSLPVLRIPHQVWPRLRRDARRSQTALLVLSPRQLAGSFAALRIALERRQARWAQRVFRGLRSEMVPQRSRGNAAMRAEIYWCSHDR